MQQNDKQRQNLHSIPQDHGVLFVNLMRNIHQQI